MMASVRLLVALVVVPLESKSCGVRGEGVVGVRLGPQSLSAFALMQAASKQHRGGPTEDDSGLEIGRSHSPGAE